MAVKTQDNINNSHPPQANGAAGGGDYSSNGKVESPGAKKLTAFQQKYMKRLLDNYKRATAQVEAAQNAANEFISACGDEVGIQVGADGWTFDVDSLEFVKIPAPVQEE